MRQAIFGVALMVGIVGLVPRVSAQAEVKVELKTAQGLSVGTATLTRATGGVNIALDLKSLPPGQHALHVHTTAACEPPAFTSAGGHLNPAAKKHGMKNPEGPHAGDMPNFTVAADGTAKATILAPGVTLGNEPNSVFANGGTALMIHAMADDMMTDPTGGAGDRLACGVIKRM